MEWFYCDALMQVNQFSGASVPEFQFKCWLISGLIKLYQFKVGFSFCCNWFVLLKVVVVVAL